MRKLWFFAIITAIGASMAVLQGCGDGGPKPEDKTAQQVEGFIADLGEAARKANGNFDSLTADEKQRFLERVGGNEQAARDMVSRMSGKGGPRGAGAPQ